jgi:hypothetical protein
MAPYPARPKNTYIREDKLQRQFVIMRVFGLVGGSDSSGRWPGAGVAIGTSAAVPLVRPAAGTGR